MCIKFYYHVNPFFYIYKNELNISGNELLIKLLIKMNILYKNNKILKI